MSEWDCKHGVSDDAQTPCPLCSRDRRIAELEDECGKLRSLLRDDRDCWARNDELEARNAKLENDRIAELEAENERLRAALQHIADASYMWADDVARKALEKGK